MLDRRNDIMNRAKYIVVEQPFGKIGMEGECIHVFPGMIDHREVFECLKKYYGENKVTLISAGFIREGQTCGHSETLKIESRSDDQILYNIMIGESI
jgi:hypothetical protein